MKRLLIVVSSFLFGCAAMLPSIESKYPDGYSKLVDIVPECKKVTLENSASCFAGAKILETTSPRKATVTFITHWEETSFGAMSRMQHAGEARFNLLDTLVAGSTITSGVKATKNILVPVLENFYNSTPSNYTKLMLPQLELAVLTSKASFDSFREAHLEATTR